MQSINLKRDQYLEFEKIALGAFAPLGGFMGENDFNSVVNNLRLTSGEVFPLPVVLDVDRHSAKRLMAEKVISLVYEGVSVGKIFPSDFYSCDRSLAARRIYGTDDVAHPGVKNFYELNDVFIGGRVEIEQRAVLDISKYEITPQQSKLIFKQRGWQSIVGFQTRNVPHRAHEYLLRIGLEICDGLFIQPLVGKKKSGDFTPEAIIAGYNALIENYLPNQKILLGTLSTTMRYAGPREAVFHAVVRRNYGCTHFIVGRDHAGVGDWYGLYDGHELTKRFDGDLGIEILRLNGPYYCNKCGSIATANSCCHAGEDCTSEISGSYMREILTRGDIPDSRYMRASVVEALNGLQCFVV